jgi:hypothetical protein
MSTQYKLVNPTIKGDLNTTVSANTPTAAANKFWQKLSKYFTNNVPLFAFSLENTNDNKLSHFTVKEVLVDDNNAEYKIKQMDLKLKKEDEEALRKNIDQAEKKMNGGKAIYDNNNNNDHSDDENKYKYNSIKNNISQPITWWWYTPAPYTYKLETVFIPTFAVPLTPYIEIQYNGIMYPWYSK